MRNKATGDALVLIEETLSIFALILKLKRVRNSARLHSRYKKKVFEPKNLSDQLLDETADSLAAADLFESVRFPNLDELKFIAIIWDSWWSLLGDGRTEGL